MMDATISSADGDENDPHRPNEPLGAKPNVKSTCVSKAEMEFFRSKFSDVSLVRYCRIHCTSCDRHLGSAPIDQGRRFEHPLLKVLMCSRCYDFYTSGEFETDEDGSELYCRWCGQGGQVYCCAICPFVFCKKCIKRNLGLNTVSCIEQSDDWLCYGCRPDDILMHRAKNWALKQYSSQLMSIDPRERTRQQNVLISQDFTTCCKRDKTKLSDIDFLRIRMRNKLSGIKRSSSKTDDRPPKNIRLWGPMVLPKGFEEVQVANHEKKDDADGVATRTAETTTTSEPPIVSEDNSDEVVCTPDILAIDEIDERDEPATEKPNKRRRSSAVDDDSDDDCKIIEDPPRKKPYVQVKPVSKLLKNALKQKNAAPAPVFQKTGRTNAPVDLPPPPSPPPTQSLVQIPAVHTDTIGPAQQAPVQHPPVQNVPVHRIPVRNVPVHRIPVRNVPVEQTPVRQPVPKTPVQQIPIEQAPVRQAPAQQIPAKPPESVPKMIKIVSPDGRSFYIDPHKLAPSSLMAAPVVVQTISTPNADGAQEKTDWFNRAIAEWQQVKQSLTTNIIELVRLYNDGMANSGHLYMNFQVKIEAAIERMENLKQRLAYEYYFKDVVSANKSDEPSGAVPSTATPDVVGDDIPPPSAIVGNDPLLAPISFNRPITLLALDPSDCPLPTMLKDYRQLVDGTRIDSPAMMITGDLTPEPAVAIETDDRGTNTNETRYYDERNGADPSSESTTNAAAQTTAYVCRSDDRTDHIYDMRVTCDSDDDAGDVGGDDDKNDSDYVVEEEDDDDTSSNVSNKSSTKSVVIINDEDGDSEIREVSFVVRHLNADDFEEEHVATNESDGRDSVDEKTRDDLENDSASSSSASENDRRSVEGTGRSVEERTETRSLSSTTTTAADDEPERQNRAIVDSEEDLVAIAEAIRESIRDVVDTRRRETTGIVAPVNDLEELLTSNVVFKKSDGAPSDAATAQPRENKKTKHAADNARSFGDAFTSFVATVSNVAEDDGGGGSDETTDKPAEIDFEKEMERLQRLAEKCIAKSNDEPEDVCDENAIVDC